MKKLVTILSFLALCLVFAPTYAAVEYRTSTDETTIVTKQDKDVEITMADIKSLSIKELEAKVGHKLTWKEKIGLKLAKNKLKRERADGGDGSFGLGFVFGFLLGLIGVLIAYLAFKGEKKTIKGAWIGVLTIVLLVLLLSVL